jgi:hypothetical protein
VAVLAVAGRFEALWLAAPLMLSSRSCFSAVLSFTFCSFSMAFTFQSLQLCGHNLSGPEIGRDLEIFMGFSAG